MTANTGAPWSIVYQLMSDPADISAAIQDLANSADTAVQSLYNAAALGAAKPAGRMSTATVQSVPDSTSTDLTWPAGSQYFDNDNMINNTGTTSRITMNSTGIYMVAIRVTFSATGSGGGVRQLSMSHSSIGVVGRNAQLGTVSDTAAITLVQAVPCYVAGQYVTFQAFQTSSAAENMATRQAQAFRLTTL
jgi:hypothetical protein